jgi:glycerol-3-phosphate dehydrogenase
VVRTQVRCEGLLREGDRVVGVMTRERGSGECVPLRARVVIDATGPWTGHWDRSSVGARPRPRLARGTHLVVPAGALPLRQTLVFFSPSDGRALFASPRGRHVIVGTTDVSHAGPPDAPTPTAGEVTYLLHALAAALPAGAIGTGVPVSAFAGVRALATRGWGPSGARTGAMDRDYAVSWDQPGLLAVRGGKLTLALDGARRALRALNRQGPALGLPPLGIPGLGTLGEPLPVPSPDAEVPDPGDTAVATPSALTWRAA